VAIKSASTPVSQYLVDHYVNGLPPLLTITRAAEVRQCHTSYIYVLLGRGRIRAVKDGRKIMIDTVSLIEDLSALPPAKIAPHPRDRRSMQAKTKREARA
jgi:excisionase family DNA binding protein